MFYEINYEITHICFLYKEFIYLKYDTINCILYK